MNYTCLIFCEGGKDRNFFELLTELEKFKYYTKNWFFAFDNASGRSPEIILQQCKKAMFGRDYQLVICIIDLDKLKSDYPKKWKEEKTRLESKYQNIGIVWQIENAEDEYKKVLGDSNLSKHKINSKAKKEIIKFIKSKLWNNLLETIQKKEKELKNIK